MATAEIHHEIRNKVPPKLSSILNENNPESREIAFNRGGDPEDLNRKFEGDLDIILAKALEKEKAHRYATPAELAVDIELFLGNRPISARPPSSLYSLGKFVRRNKRVLSLTAFALLLLMSISTTFTLALIKEQKQTAQERDSAITVTEFMVNLFLMADPNHTLGEEIKVRDVLDTVSVGLLDILGRKPEVQARMNDCVGRIYQHIGQYEKAGPLLNAARKIREDLYKDGHPHLLESLNHWGKFLIESGKHQEAEPVLLRTLAIAIKDNPSQYVTSRINLAHLYHQMGKLQEAERLLRQAFEVVHQLNEEDAIYLYDGLAAILVANHKFSEAETLYKECLRRSRENNRDIHPNTTAAKNNYAGLLHLTGNKERALEMYKDSLASNIKFFGDQSPNLIANHSNLAVLHREIGDQTSALSHSRKSLTLSRQFLGDHHPNLIYLLNNAAIMLLDFGELEESKRHCEEAMNIAREVWSEDHPYMLYPISGQARWYLEAGEHQASIAAYYRTRKLMAGLVGDDHPELYKLDLSISEAMSLSGNHGESLRIARAALDVLQSHYPDNHKAVVLAESLIGQGMAKTGATLEGEILLERAAVKTLQSPNCHNIQSRRIASRLIDYLKTQDRLAETAEWQTLFSIE